MFTLLRAVMGLVLLVGWAVAAASIYVIRTPAGGFEFVTKNQLTFSDTYVDARQWSSGDEEKHADFFARLTDLKKTDLLKPAPADAVADADPTPVTDKSPAAKPTGSWYSQAGAGAAAAAAGRRP